MSKFFKTKTEKGDNTSPHLKKKYTFRRSLGMIGLQMKLLRLHASKTRRVPHKYSRVSCRSRTAQNRELFNMRLIFSYRNYIQIQNKKQGLQLVIAPKSYAPRWESTRETRASRGSRRHGNARPDSIAPRATGGFKTGKNNYKITNLKSTKSIVSILIRNSFFLRSFAAFKANSLLDKIQLERFT